MNSNASGRGELKKVERETRGSHVRKVAAPRTNSRFAVQDGVDVRDEICQRRVTERQASADDTRFVMCSRDGVRRQASGLWP